MVNVLILLPWYLNKLCLEVAYSILHLLKVLLHPFILTFIVTIDLTGYYLRVVIHDYICSSCRFGEIQSCYQSFVLCLVIGRREIKMDHVFDPVPLRVVEYHTSSACLLIRRSVRVDALLWALFCPLAFHESEFCDEVSEHLPLYSYVKSILYVEFAQFDYP